MWATPVFRSRVPSDLHHPMMARDDLYFVCFPHLSLVESQDSYTTLSTSFSLYVRQASAGSCICLLRELSRIGILGANQPFCSRFSLAYDWCGNIISYVRLKPCWKWYKHSLCEEGHSFCSVQGTLPILPTGSNMWKARVWSTWKGITFWKCNNFG